LNSSNVPVFVDVRSRDLYDMEHIPGARNIPNTFAAASPTATDDPLFNIWKALPVDKLIIFYCD
jgi:rhodanese-related sulfurtransferase